MAPHGRGRSRLLRAAVLAASIITASTTAAQPAPSAEVAPEPVTDVPGRSLPQRLSERPLTLPRGKVALLSAFAVDLYRADSPDDECVVTATGVICLGDERGGRGRHEIGSSVGVAFGVMDALEVGVVPLRLRTGIDESGGREPLVRDPRLYVRAAPLRLERFQLGASYHVFLPLSPETRWLTQWLSLDLLVRSRFVRAEASTFLRFDSPVRETLTARERIITPGVAVELTGQVADPFAVFVGFQSSFLDARAEGHSTDVRTGVMGTIRRPGGGPLADIRFTFHVRDVKRTPEPESPTPCPSADPACLGGGPAFAPTPIRHYTLELGATFYFHDAW